MGKIGKYQAEKGGKWLYFLLHLYFYPWNEGVHPVKEIAVKLARVDRKGAFYCGRVPLVEPEMTPYGPQF